MKKINILLFSTLLSTYSLANAQNNEADEKQAQAAFYTLGYDIAPQQWNNVIKTDIDYLKNHPVNYLEDLDTLKIPSTSQKKITYDAKQLCKFADMSANCLITAKKNQKKLRVLFAKLSHTNAQFDTLLAQTQHQNENSIVFTSPIPKTLLQTNLVNTNHFKLLANLLLVRNAFTYLDDKDKGILQTCQSIALGRGLIGNNSDYIQSILGAFLVKLNSKLLNDMLVDSQKPLPKTCHSLLTPLPVEKISLCHDKVESEVMVKTLSLVKEKAKNFSNQKEDKALYQKQYDRVCDKEQLSAINKDIPVPPLKKFILTNSDCLKAPYACLAIKGAQKQGVLVDNRYQALYQDANATLRLWSQLHNKDCQIESTYTNQWNKARDLKRDKQGNYSFKNYSKKNEARSTVVCPQNNWGVVFQK